MNASGSRLVLAVLTLVASLAATPADAQPYGYVTYTSPHRLVTWGSVSLADDLLEGSYWMSHGSAQSAPGVLRSASESQETRGWMDVYAASEAGWVAPVRIDSPGLAGQTGFAAITVNYTWTFAHAAAPFDPLVTPILWAHNAELRLLFGSGGAVARNWANSKSGQLILVGLDVAGDAIAGPYATGVYFRAIFPFTFGAATHMDFRLSTETEVRNSYALAGAAHSAYWGGMQVYDAAMRPVAFSSDSPLGIDFAKNYAPVPEPASASLAVLGLLTLWAMHHSASRPHSRSGHVVGRGAKRRRR